MKLRILLVDDDAAHRRLVRKLLEERGFSVTAADGGAQALTSVLKSRPDLVLADVAMPKMSGVTLCQQLRADLRTRGLPVILMSGALKEESEQADGIERGADDYLLKPIDRRLLFAKLAAVIRRYGAPAELQETLEAEGLTLDVQARTVKLKGRPVSLTRKEFDLLTTLMRRRGKVVSASFLLRHVWGYDPAHYDDPHTVESHLSSLRRKLGPRLSGRIVTVPACGYRFDKS